MTTHHQTRDRGSAKIALAAVLSFTLTGFLTSGPSAAARGIAPNVAALAVDTGDPMPVGDLDGWRQNFTDDFTTDVALGSFPAAVSSTWSAYPYPYPDSTHHGTYAPTKVVSIADGVLTEFIHTENRRHLIAAVLPKIPGTEQEHLYGRFAVRWRSDKLPGYKVAWLLWPNSKVWPRDGEIDFPEMNLDSPTVGAFVHLQGATSGEEQWRVKAPLDITAWHTTVIEWSPNLVVFKVDGQEIGRTTQRIPNTPMHWVLQTETMLGGTRPANWVQGNVQIDWVAAWRYDPTATETPITPSVTLTAPSAGDVVSGMVALAATCVDRADVSMVKWYVDGVEVAHESYTGDDVPWTDSWDSTSVANGAHWIFSKARRATGEWMTSRAVTLTVANP